MNLQLFFCFIAPSSASHRKCEKLKSWDRRDSKTKNNKHEKFISDWCVRCADVIGGWKQKNEQKFHEFFAIVWWHWKQKNLSWRSEAGFEPSSRCFFLSFGELSSLIRPITGATTRALIINHRRKANCYHSPFIFHVSRFVVRHELRQLDWSRSEIDCDILRLFLHCVSRARILGSREAEEWRNNNKRARSTASTLTILKEFFLQFSGGVERTRRVAKPARVSYDFSACSGPVKHEKLSEHKKREIRS